MPSGKFLNRTNLLPAIQQGKVQVATIDDKVRRILRVGAQLGWLDREQTDYSIPRFNQQGRQVALQGARESMVLLKNERQLLPLSKQNIKSIAVIGPDAYPAVPDGGGSARVRPFAAVSFLEGLSNRPGSSVSVYSDHGIPTLEEMARATNFSTAAANGKPGLNAEYFKSEDLSGEAAVTRTEANVNFGENSNQVFPEYTLSDRWTGYYSPKTAGSYDLFVQSTGEAGGHYRLYVDDQLVFDNWNVSTALMDSKSIQLDVTSHRVVFEHHGRSGWLGTRLRLGIVPHAEVVNQQAKKLAAQAEVVVVAVGFDPETESEGADRTFSLPPGQEQLIQEMIAANKNVVVVITGGGSVDMNSWIDRVPAVLQAWYPGQEGGTALADILFGDVNPSGHLPVSFERRWEDNPVHDSYYPDKGTKRVPYKEGVFVGYRGYERSGKKPLFPFGYGLSYTSFTYGNLSVNNAGGGNAEVSFDVTNTGKREGTEVAQLYVADKHSRVPRPAKELKGFSRVELKAGEKRRVTIKLDKRALSYYDVDSKQWRAEPGEFEVLVGSSNENIRIQGKLTLTAADASVSVPNSD